MIASLPRLLLAISTTAVMLSACQPRSDLAPDRTTPIAAAQRVTLDPVTHLPVATVSADAVGDAQPAGVTAGVSAALSATAGPREANEVHLPDGTVGVRVDQRYFDTVTVCRQPDGSFGSACPAGKAPRQP